ncbi:hypothetical protein ACFLZ6_00125 [Nanoarchaeota archaeon]
MIQPNLNTIIASLLLLILLVLIALSYVLKDNSKQWGKLWQIFSIPQRGGGTGEEVDADGLLPFASLTVTKSCQGTVIEERQFQFRARTYEQVLSGIASLKILAEAKVEQEEVKTEQDGRARPVKMARDNKRVQV